MNVVDSWQKKYEFLVFDHIDSTHLEAKKLAKTNDTQDFVIVARSQKQGRGRNARKWSSPEGNLFCSLLLQREISTNIITQLHFVTALAIKEALIECGVRSHLVLLKWPNDIMLNNAKCGGILLESNLSPNRHVSKSIIISIGLNCLNKPKINEDFPAYHPTSLKEAGYNNILPDNILHALIPSIEKSYLLWMDQGFSIIKQQWLKSAFNLGKAVTLHNNDERISGIFQSIDDNGNLELELEGGYKVKIDSGEVISHCL